MWWSLVELSSVLKDSTSLWEIQLYSHTNGNSFSILSPHIWTYFHIHGMSAPFLQRVFITASQPWSLHRVFEQSFGLIDFPYIFAFASSVLAWKKRSWSADLFCPLNWLTLDKLHSISRKTPIHQYSQFFMFVES